MSAETNRFKATTKAIVLIGGIALSQAGDAVSFITTDVAPAAAEAYLVSPVDEIGISLNGTRGDQNATMPTNAVTEQQAKHTRNTAASKPQRASFPPDRQRVPQIHGNRPQGYPHRRD